MIERIEQIGQHETEGELVQLGCPRQIGEVHFEQALSHLVEALGLAADRVHRLFAHLEAGGLQFVDQGGGEDVGTALDLVGRTIQRDLDFLRGGLAGPEDEGGARGQGRALQMTGMSGHGLHTSRYLMKPNRRGRNRLTSGTRAMTKSSASSTKTNGMIARFSSQ